MKATADLSTRIGSLGLGVFFFLSTLTFLLLTHHENVGFESGHHGWVSSHALAIASHVSPETGLVGFSVATVDADGTRQTHYYDRYPPFFTNLLAVIVQSEEATLAERIARTRILMNIIFAAAMAVAFLEIKRISSTILAAATVLLTFSGYFLQYYRDMVHFDQPAVLGVLVFFYGLLVHRQTGKQWPVFGAAMLAVSLGRGYAAVAVIAFWVVVEFGGLLVTHYRGRKAFPWGAFLLSDAVRVFVLALSLSVVYLFYNVYWESRSRGVSIQQTSIVGSAARRTGLSSDFAVRERKVPLTWGRHAELQVRRLGQMFVPYPFFVSEDVKRAVPWYINRINLWLIAGFVVGAAVSAMSLLWRLRTDSRVVVVVMTFGGIAWLAPMKNLAIPHDYTSMYHVGFVLLAVLGALRLLPQRTHGVTLLASAFVFFLSTTAVTDTRNWNAGEANAYTAELERVAMMLPDGATVYVDDGGGEMLRIDGATEVVPGAPYATAFFLSGSVLGTLPVSEFALSRNKDFKPEGSAAPWILLTPDAQRVFLFERNGADD